MTRNSLCKKSVPPFILLLLFFFQFACKQTASTEKVEQSPQSKKIVAHMDSLIYAGFNEQALTYLDSAYGKLKAPNLMDIYNKYYAKAVYYYHRQPDTAKANLYADSMHYILKGKEGLYRSAYANAIFTKGDALVLTKMYNTAFNYYYNAGQLALKNLDSCDSYGFNYRLGLLKYNQHQYLDAVTYLKKAFSESKNCDHEESLKATFISRQSYINTIALCFEKANKPDSAIYYYRKAIAFLDESLIKYPQQADFLTIAHGVVYGNLGGVYAKIKHDGEAEKYLKESIKINDQPSHDQADAQTAKIKLASLYLDLKRFKEAKILLNELQLVLDGKLKDQKMTVSSQIKLYRLKWSYFDQIHNVPEAIEHMQLYHQLDDSLNTENESLRKADINLSFKASEQEYKIALLNKDNKIKKNYLIIFIFFTVITIALLSLILFNREKLKVMNREITAQNLNMQKLLSTLEQTQQENTRMMKIMAHDLRSPIAAAISISGILKTTALPQADLEMLDLLEVSSQRSLEMITNLLNINAETADLIKESVEMHTLLNYCANLFKFKALEKKQKLNLKVQNITIQADGRKIWRVFSNLIANAIKFSPIGAEIKITTEETLKTVMVTIEDNGIGVPAELGNTIFDLFTVAQREGTMGEYSSGLGLAISKQIVEAHQGKIWFESELNQGTTFFVELPLK
ncbi:HAMP domain-containing sensor histidine kinase [Pedobacter psychrodurus]|uniref:tetratricopeptide repeat-containing sensor histidine kinase n=1 Tax=Pedobacter psychrodurus TaxID=2530456 RepID=UPI00292D9943|nr:HAMP domain-containing sensor histidine kinase [Pedobacter psychrodurus]